MTISKAARGSALFYILFAIVLLGLITAFVTRQQSGQVNTNRLNSQKAELLATKVMEHITAVKIAVEQMEADGIDPATISFLMPEETGFDTPPHTNKVFHIQGGGVRPLANLSDIIVGNSAIYGLRWGRNTNVEWTPTTAHDVIYSFFNIDPDICRVVNERVSGSNVTPIPSPVHGWRYFIEDDTNYAPGNPDPDEDFTTTECAACEGHQTLCLYNNLTGVQENYFLYSVVLAR